VFTFDCAYLLKNVLLFEKGFDEEVAEDVQTLKKTIFSQFEVILLFSCGRFGVGYTLVLRDTLTQSSPVLIFLSACEEHVFQEVSQS
jgi:hypothetical protein